MTARKTRQEARKAKRRSRRSSNLFALLLIGFLFVAYMAHNKTQKVLSDIVQAVTEIERISMTPSTKQVDWRDYQGFDSFENSYVTIVNGNEVKLVWDLLPAVEFSVKGLDELNFFVNNEKELWCHRRPNNSFSIPDPDGDGKTNMRKFYLSYYGEEIFLYKEQLIQIRKEIKGQLRQMRRDARIARRS